MQISSLTTNLDNPVQSSHIHPHLHGFCRQHNDQLHPTICGKDEVFHADEHSRGQGFLGSRDKDSWESLSPIVFTIPFRITRILKKLLPRVLAPVHESMPYTSNETIPAFIFEANA